MRIFQQIKRIHHFFINQHLYPLILSTTLVFGFYSARVIYTGTLTYTFLLWNLFLAWIPYLLSTIIVHSNQNKVKGATALLLLGPLWLLFFPNSAYILTDFVNLQNWRGIPYWYDVGLVVAAAWTGLVLGIVSLRSMQGLIEKIAGKITSWLFVFGVAGLTGYGIYLGRVVRLNSWDLFSDPFQIIWNIGSQIRHPLRNIEAYGFSVMFAAIILVIYLTFSSIKPVNTAAERERSSG